MKISGRTVLRIAVVIVALAILGWNYARSHRANEPVADDSMPVAVASAGNPQSKPIRKWRRHSRRC